MASNWVMWIWGPRECARLSAIEYMFPVSASKCMFLLRHDSIQKGSPTNPPTESMPIWLPSTLRSSYFLEHGCTIKNVFMYFAHMCISFVLLNANEGNSFQENLDFHN